MTEKEKFWHETIRMILFGLAGFISIYILAVVFSQNKEYQAFLNREKIQIRVHVIDEYMKESYKYTSILYDTLYNGRKDDTSDIDSQFDKYRIAMNSMKIYFGAQVDNHIDDINEAFIPKLNPRTPSRNWKDIRSQLKNKNLKICELALMELQLSL